MAHSGFVNHQFFPGQLDLRKVAFENARNLMKRMGITRPLNVVRGGFIPNVPANYSFDPARDMENIEGIVFNISLKLFDPSLSDDTIRHLHRQLMKIEDHLRNTGDRRAANTDEEMEVILKAQKMKASLDGKEEKLNKKIIKAQQKLDELSQLKATQEDPKAAMWKKITESRSTSGRPSEVFGIQRKVRKLRGEPKSHRRLPDIEDEPMDIDPPKRRRRRAHKAKAVTLMDVEKRAPRRHFSPPPAGDDGDMDDLSDQLDRFHLGDGLRSTKLTRRIGRSTAALMRYNCRLKKFRMANPQLSLSEARVMMGKDDKS